MYEMSVFFCCIEKFFRLLGWSCLFLPTVYALNACL